jgi:F-type H+-transporting ATPase subunit b
MLKRIVLALVLTTWMAAPAPAQDHGTAAAKDGTSHTDATGKPNEVRAAGQGVESGHGSDAAHTGAAVDHDGGHAKAPLLPDPTSRETQLQALWVIIIFLVLVVVLYFTAWKNVLAGLKSREERIRRDIADAEASRAKAETTLREYNQQLATAEGKIRDMLAKAQADGERIATNLRMQAQTESEEIKNRATREIEASRELAVAEFRQYAADVATAVAEKILRRNLNADDQRDLVTRSLEQVGTIGKN